MLAHSKRWEELKTRYFGFHRDLPPAAVARILGGRIVFSEARKGQWVAVVEMERAEIQEAEVGSQGIRAQGSGVRRLTQEFSSLLHQMAGMRFDYQPDVAARFELQSFARGQREMDFQFHAAVHPGGNDHIAAFE